MIGPDSRHFPKVDTPLFQDSDNRSNPSVSTKSQRGFMEEIGFIPCVLTEKDRETIRFIEWCEKKIREVFLSVGFIANPNGQSKFNVKHKGEYEY